MCPSDLTQSSSSTGSLLWPPGLGQGPFLHVISISDIFPIILHDNFLSILFFYLLILETGKEREKDRQSGRQTHRQRETLICCFTYLLIFWLILVCALNGDQTCNLGILGWCSNQLRYLAKASCPFKNLVWVPTKQTLRQRYEVSVLWLGGNAR